MRRLSARVGNVIKRRLIIGAIVPGIPALAIAWWLGSPLFLDSEVSEEFPMSAGAIVPDNMTGDEVETEMEEAAEAPDVGASEKMMPQDPSSQTVP